MLLARIKMHATGRKRDGDVRQARRLSTDPQLPLLQLPLLQLPLLCVPSLLTALSSTPRIEGAQRPHDLEAGRSLLAAGAPYAHQP